MKENKKKGTISIAVSYPNIQTKNLVLVIPILIPVKLTAIYELQKQLNQRVYVAEEREISQPSG